jgi:hypothetical protein
MRTFRDIPIRHKLIVLVMVTTATALLLAGFGVVAFDSYSTDSSGVMVIAG